MNLLSQLGFSFNSFKKWYIKVKLLATLMKSNKNFNFLMEMT